MENIIQSMLKTLKRIKSKTGLYIIENGYIALNNYVGGYLLGVEETTGLAFNYYFTLWLNRKYARKSNLVWSVQIMILDANRNEELACKLLFDNIIEFLEEFSSTPDMHEILVKNAEPF